MNASGSVAVGGRGGGRFLNVALLGREETVAALRNAPYAVQVQAVRPALRAGANLLMGVIRVFAPGNLGAGNWRVRAKRRSRVRIGFTVYSPTKENLGIPAERKSGGTTGYFPAASEFGWLSRGRLPTGGLRIALGIAKRIAGDGGAAYRALNPRFIAGRHWMRSAMQDAESSVFNTVATTIAQRLEAMKPEAFQTASMEFDSEDEA